MDRRLTLPISEPPLKFASGRSEKLTSKKDSRNWPGLDPDRAIWVVMVLAGPDPDWAIWIVMVYGPYTSNNSSIATYIYKKVSM